MALLQTHTGHIYSVEYAGPTTRSNGTVFSARIHNVNYSDVNRVFSDENSTEVLTVVFGEDSDDPLVEVYQGYTIYLGFMIQDDGSIIVRLQKKPEA